jgi:hypothetical protein
MRRTILALTTVLCLAFAMTADAHGRRRGYYGHRGPSLADIMIGRQANRLTFQLRQIEPYDSYRSRDSYRPRYARRAYAADEERDWLCNESDNVLVVLVDGRAIGTLAPHRKVRISNLPSGKITLEEK